MDKASGSKSKNKDKTVFNLSNAVQADPMDAKKGRKGKGQGSKMAEKESGSGINQSDPAAATSPDKSPVGPHVDIMKVVAEMQAVMQQSMLESQKQNAIMVSQALQEAGLKLPQDGKNMGHDDEGSHDGSEEHCEGLTDDDNESAYDRPRKRKHVAHDLSDTGSDDELLGRIDRLVKTKPNDKGAQFLKDFAQNLEIDEEEGPAISDEVADILQGLLQKRVSEDKVKDKMADIKPPSNCPSLTTVKVNPEVWNKMKNHTRSRDLRMQRVQTRAVKAMSPLAYIIDRLVNCQKTGKAPSAEDVQDMLSASLEAFTMGASAIQEVNLRRKELIKPDLNDRYQQLCGPATPVSKFLFGDDLAKAVKDINETSKMEYDIMGYNKNKRFRGDYYSKGKTPFSGYQKGQRPKNGGYSKNGGHAKANNNSSSHRGGHQGGGNYRGGQGRRW